MRPLRPGAAFGIAVFVLALAIQAPAVFGPLNPYDEGLILTGASRALDGQVPYRDFWTLYGPGSFYLHAAAFAAFGRRILVERTVSIVAQAALAAVLALLGARLAPRGLGLAVGLIAAGWLGHLRSFGYPLVPALFLSYASLAFLSAGSCSLLITFTAGACAGLAALFRHDIGAYGVLAGVVASAGSSWGPREDGVRAGAPGRVLLAYAGGLALVCVPAALALLAAVPPERLVEQLFAFPGRVFPEVRSLPFPRLRWARGALPYYLPFLVTPLAVALTLLTPRSAERGSRDETGTLRWTTAAIAVSGLLGFNQVRVRPSNEHALAFFLPCLILLAVVYARAGELGPAPRRMMRGLAVFFLLATAIQPLVEYRKLLRDLPREVARASVTRSSLPAAWPAHLREDQARAVTEVRLRTAPGEPIYVGLVDHARVFVNDASFYFLASRPCPSRFDELHPGVIERPEVQDEIVAELERARVRCVVLVDLPTGDVHRRRPGIPGTAGRLDAWIRERFRRVWREGQYQVWWRRS